MKENIEVVKFKITENKTKEFSIQTLDEIMTPQNIPLSTKHHRITFYTLIFITNGSGTHEVDFKEYPVQTADIIFFAKDRVERFVDFKHLEGFYLKFTEEFLYKTLGNYALEVIDLFRQTYIFPVLSLINSMVSSHVTLLKDSFDTYGNIDFDIISSAFRTLILVIRQNCSIINKTIQLNNSLFIQLVHLVDHHLHEYKSVEDYSKLMNVSKKTINLLTKTSLNLSAKSFINERILQKAKISLCFENKSIDEISYQLGFSEPSNFSRFFKNHEGVTPMAFRRIHGN
ncbi:AraC family transcriptional regulator [Paenibacillus peoriae]|uniref:helix-turn-helix domain-containing protein n=1 Tax=Paenibacillus peoriae TaxID=59893 RepID=UPI00026C5F4C|nr:AraC family transcriptional regulator [Paenibacillus peoriae]MEC0180639.1 AraC family transcriptional regulator [Paenibacillus peoriae]